MKYKYSWTEFHNFEAVVEVPESFKDPEKEENLYLQMEARQAIIDWICENATIDSREPYEINTDWDTMWVEKIKESKNEI